MIEQYKKLQISDAEACTLMINGETLYSSQGIVKLYWDEHSLEFMQSTDGITQKPIEFGSAIVYHRKHMLSKQEVFTELVEGCRYLDPSDHLHELMRDSDYAKELDELIEVCVKLKEGFDNDNA